MWLLRRPEPLWGPWECVHSVVYYPGYSELPRDMHSSVFIPHIAHLVCIFSLEVNGFKLREFVYTCSVCVYTCFCMCWCILGSGVDIRHPSQLLFTYFLRHGLLLNLQVSDWLDGLAKEPQAFTKLLHCPALGLQTGTAKPGCYVGAGEPVLGQNSGLCKKCFTAWVVEAGEGSESLFLES